MDQQYQFNNPGTVTYIDDLPDIDEIDGMGQGGYNGQYNSTHGNSHPDYNKAYSRPIQEPSHTQLQAKVRQAHVPPIESGMHIVPANQGMVNTSISQENYMPPPPPPSSPHQSIHDGNSCLAIAEHVKDCPICSKFYKNDNTVYIIVIVVLAIICILLLKRVLDI